jgi:hypothetical protein
LLTCTGVRRKCRADKHRPRNDVKLFSEKG